MKQGLLFNPMDPAYINNPYPTLMQLQLHDPIHRSPLGFWFLTRFDDVKALLHDDRFAHEHQARMEKKHGNDAMSHGSIRYLSNSILLQNPPKHTQLRKVMAPFFSRRSLQARQPRLDWAIDLAFEKIKATNNTTDNLVEFDFIGELAQPVLGHLICDILGIPEADRDPFVGTTCLSPRTLDPVPVPPDTRAFLDQQVDELTPYFQSLFDQKRKTPQDDLISAMVSYLESSSESTSTTTPSNSSSTTPSITERDLIDNCLFLFAAGQEVTKCLMGNALVDLTAHPEQWQALVNNPKLSDQALEELARYGTALQMTHRVVAEPFEYEGKSFQRGDVVILSLAAANRDPSANPNANQLDLAREKVNHVAFGYGIHYCIGAHLGIFECRAIFEALFSRFDHTEDPLHVIDQPLEWEPTITVRGLKRLILKGRLNDPQ